MRHAKVGRRLSRSASHRKALLSALSVALIKHKRIQTTAAKAKETRRIVEPLITRARDAYRREQSGEPVDVHARRVIAKFIRDKEALKLLFSEIAEKVGTRQGGYTRVLKLGTRLGDGAEMAVIELVDYNDAQDSKKRRDRVAGSKAALQRRKAAEERKAKAAAAETHDEAEHAISKDAEEAPDTVTDEAVIDEPAADAPAETAEATADDAPLAEAAPEQPAVDETPTADDTDKDNKA
jgi:large subunit ribosomal protein L17